jgi:hypothetical protein
LEREREKVVRARDEGGGAKYQIPTVGLWRIFAVETANISLCNNNDHSPRPGGPVLPGHSCLSGVMHLVSVIQSIIHAGEKKCRYFLHYTPLLQYVGGQM